MTTIRHVAIEEFMDMPLGARGPGALLKQLNRDFWGSHYLVQQRLPVGPPRWKALDREFARRDKAKWSDEHSKSDPYIHHQQRREPPTWQDHPMMYSTGDLPMLEQALATVLAKEAEAKERRNAKKARKETQK